jgi:hypothetical protein
MPLAAGFDPDFDARWFGWFNPAETVLRAIRARGDAVSAIATTWAQESEEINEAVTDVAIGVMPACSPSEADASQLTRGRSHRLETVDPALFQELSRADEVAVDRYCAQLTQQVAFSGGPELSRIAETVAMQMVVSGRWPTGGEWDALRAEYERARLMAGSQHPGLMGVEDPAQSVAYQRDFVLCRRLETLICRESGTPADIVYAARAAGVVAPVTESAA